MVSFISASKGFKGLLLRNASVRQFIRCSKKNAQLGHYVHARCLSSNAGGIQAFGMTNMSIAAAHKDVYFSTASVFNSSLQKRGFLGCGDGEEGDVLSKVYEEKRVMGYTPEQLYAVVAAVDLYEDFLPWCQRSEIIQRHPDGSFDAELEIGFKFLVESYVSHVELKKAKSVKTTASESNLFDHLINLWEFNPGPVPGTCNLHFLVDFKFQSPFYRQMANIFFKEVVSRLVGSFNDRCHVIYGPEVPVLENSYKH